MTDPGLNHRLRQRSRRSGIMIGLSMLLTLAVCVGSFTVIYSRLEPVVADFVGQGDIELPTAVPTQPPAPTEPPAAEPTAPPAEEAEPTTPPEQGGDNQAGEIEQEEEDPEEFTPDLQIDANQPINLRPGPGVNSGDALTALGLGQPLQSTGERQETSDPERDQMDPGQEWIEVRTEDGTVGWVREFDISEYVP